jgi:hypothetical protein
LKNGWSLSSGGHKKMPAAASDSVVVDLLAEVLRRALDRARDPEVQRWLAAMLADGEPNNQAAERCSSAE